MAHINRRRVLRGVLSGGAVTVALPLLNGTLNGNGNAMADGSPLPVRFGTWFWGLGMQKKIFVPTKVGADFDLPEEIAALAPVKKDINLFTDVTAFRDTEPLMCHYSGWVIGMSGIAPKARGDRPGESIDTTIANQIGRSTRFKTLTATASGDVRATVSYEGQNAISTPEFSPLNFYTRLFGSDFQDPNAPEFKPNPRTMVRKSVLSSMLDDIKVLERDAGAEDKARLDQYFTGLRHIEQQLDQQLVKPEPRAACVAPKPLTKEPASGGEAAIVSERHKIMTNLMVMAVACDQTRVFNMTYSDASANTTKAGYEKPHHTTTHEESVDERLGYQENCSWFTRRSMEAWAYYVKAFGDLKEGDGRLLDNVLIYAVTDNGYARLHTLDGMPAFTAGRAGGKVKTGLHIAAGGATIARLGYTVQRVMGVDTPSWGTRSNNTSKEFGEILA